MQCTNCKREITFIVNGAPKDKCWDCLPEEEKQATIRYNMANRTITLPTDKYPHSVSKIRSDVGKVNH